MSDPAHDATDKILQAVEKRIKLEYAQAQREIEAKLQDYLKRYKTKDKTWRKWVKNGQRTKQQYNEWRVGQLAIGKRWQDQRDAIARELTITQELAKKVVYSTMPEVYALNINYATYDIETGTMIDTSFALVNRDTAAAILKERKLYHDPGASTLENIADGLTMQWNREKIQSVMLQAILQGESIPDIATRLSKTVSESNMKVSIRNARTMTTGVENVARIDGYNRAKRMGINLQKQWMATLDNRTRHAHRLLDGQIVDVNKPFKVDGYDIRYPGDPEAPGYLLYNCRCTLVSAIKGFDNDLSDVAQRNNKLKGMSYKQWRKAKAESKPILSQMELSQAMKESWLNLYKGFFDKG